MKPLADVYKPIREAIVAFVPRYPVAPESDWSECSHLQRIIGTGFVVGESLIATNRHVAEQFAKQPGGTASVPFPVCAVVFRKLPQGLAMALLNVCQVAVVSGSIRTKAEGYETSPPDLALLSVECTGLDRCAVTLSKQHPPVGTEIATAGFSLGSWLLAPNGKPERFGPVLQRGIVAGESPFESEHPHSLMIDVMVQGGASGSPVFRCDNGEVVGVVYARQPDVQEVEINGATIFVSEPTSFSHVVPVQFLHKLIHETGSQLLSFVPTSAPRIDTVFESMPRTPQQQITSGSYPHVRG